MRILGHRAGHGHGHGHGRPAHDDPTAFQGSAGHYDRIAGLFLRGAYRRVARDVVGGLPADGSVLDVGTGPGHLLVEIARLRPDVRVTGVDPATDMVEVTGRHLAAFGPRASAVVGDVADLPFEDGAFDVVVSSLSLHHWADPARGGAELDRVRRPGGQIRVYDLRSAPFAELQRAVTGDRGTPRPDRFRVTPLPVPALRRLVL